MKQIIGVLLVGWGASVILGCSGDKKITGPQGQSIEVWEEKFNDGKLQTKYQYFRDNEGKQVLHGYYKEYYENGKIKSERNFNTGRLDVKQMQYYENGKVKSERVFYDGIMMGRGMPVLYY
mgnify:CR=1 FL=1